MNATLRGPAFRVELAPGFPVPAWRNPPVEIRPDEFTIPVGQSANFSATVTLPRTGISWLMLAITGGVAASAGGASAAWLVKWSVSPGIDVGAGTVHTKAGSNNTDISGFNLMFLIPVNGSAGSQTTFLTTVTVQNGNGPLTFLGQGSSDGPRLQAMVVDMGPG